MFRIAAAIYLMLAQAAAPVLCCCATARLASPAPQPISPSESSRPESPCCCCSQPTPRSDRPVPAAPRPPSRPDCPCQNGPDRSVALASDLESSRQLQPGGPAHDTPFAPSLLPVDSCSFAGELSAFPMGRLALPYRSADDVMRAMHFLRC